MLKDIFRESFHSVWAKASAKKQKQNVQYNSKNTTLPTTVIYNF